MDSSFLISNMTINSFCFRSNVPESASYGRRKTHDILQERVDAEESAKHQEPDVNNTEKPNNTNSVEKRSKVFRLTAMSTESL